MLEGGGAQRIRQCQLQGLNFMMNGSELRRTEFPLVNIKMNGTELKCPGSNAKRSLSSENLLGLGLPTWSSSRPCVNGYSRQQERFQCCRA